MEHSEDDVFRLTPVDVRRYEFGASMRGYDRARVDQFKEQVADELERLLRETVDLETRARGIHEQLKSYRERDKAINEALVSAQQLREQMKEQASKEADLIIREAHAAAEQIQRDAYAKLEQLNSEIDQLRRQRRAYLSQVRVMAERHLAEVDAWEEAPSAEPPTAPRNSGAARSSEAARSAAALRASGAVPAPVERPPVAQPATDPEQG